MAREPRRLVQILWDGEDWGSEKSVGNRNTQLSDYDTALCQQGE